MASPQTAMLTTLRQLLDSGPVAGLDDGQLLERFATRRDEAAFAALVALHGPMVLGVCRRILRDGHDVEDAFQATFLVLVRRAGSLRDPGRLGPWLHGVARRVSLRARAEAARRRSHEGPPEPREIAEESTMRPASRAEGKDVREVIDEEIARLPARFREAVVLCDLEGRSYAEAARRFRCPLGTLQSRLARGRARLRTRLVRRGVVPTAVAVILADSARAAVPEALAEATIRAATTGAASATAVALAGHLARSPALSMVKNLAVTFCLASVVLGAGLLGRGRILSVGPPEISPEAAAALEGAQPPPREPQPTQTDRTLRLEVVDRQDHSPLPGAEVWVRVRRGQDHAVQGTTDEQGRFPIELSGDTTYSLRVVASHPGFVPIEVNWPGDRIPDAYALALPRGVTIGGVVRDEQGRPIAGARVFPSFNGIVGAGWPEGYATTGAEVAGVLTDADGRWRSDALPASAGPDARLRVWFTHSGYSAAERSLTAEEARKLSTVQVLKAGAAISGTVLSPTGRPVAGASVVLQPMGNGWDRPQRLQTDARGRFGSGRFIDPQMAEVMLTVQADGLAWAIRRITVAPEIPSQVITLAPRRPLRGRVVDSNGRPIAGVAVGSTGGLGNGHFDWETTTDADGRFVWYEAPVEGEILLDAYKAPYVQALGRRIEAGAEDVTITLHRPQNLHGTVTEAETGRPIERFTLLPGWGPHRPGLRPEWLQESGRAFGAGRFDLTRLFPDQGFPRSIRIEADGYEPGELLGLLDNQEDVAHDFKLRKARPLEGIVRGPDGRPLAGVDVALSGSDYDARIENGRFHANRVVREVPHMKTGPDGRYHFRPPGERVAILAVHDAGVAICSAEEVAASTDITLEPWGRIEGILRIGDRPAPGQKVAAWLTNSGFSGRVDYDTTTDASGRFVFERITPGRMEVYRYVDDANHRGWTASNPVPVPVKPGETVRVQVGGTGRPVVGRLILPHGVTLSDLVLSHGSHLTTGYRWPPTPVDYPDFSPQQRAAWWDSFRKTSEGRAYFEGRERQYALDLHPDGTCRIDDVPAGRYILRLPFEGWTEGDRSDRRAFARVDVVVPPIPGGRSDEPLDIGAIPLAVFSFRAPSVGDRVPTIPSGAADGRPLDLAALRGKFVLLHFWATHDEETPATVPRLKETFDAFGRDPRFVMIGLNQDESADRMRRYAAHRGLNWEQRHIGSAYEPNPIAAAFGVRYPPAAFLIGPDGRIIAKDLPGEAIKQAVAKALR